MSDQGLNTDLVNKLIHLHHALSALQQAGYSVTIEHHSMPPLAMGNTVPIVNVTNRYYRNARNEQIPYGQMLTIGGEHATLSFPIVEQNPPLYHFRHNHHMLAVFKGGESKPVPFPQWHGQLPPLSAYGFDQAHDALALYRFRQMQHMEKMDLTDLQAMSLDEEPETIKLTETAAAQLADLLANPPAPNEALRQARTKYKQRQVAFTCMCPACKAVWVFYPDAVTHFGQDTLGLKSAKSCNQCEMGGVEQLQALYRDTDVAEEALRSITSPLALDEAKKYLVAPSLIKPIEDNEA